MGTSYLLYTKIAQVRVKDRVGPKYKLKSKYKQIVNVAAKLRLGIFSMFNLHVKY